MTKRPYKQFNTYQEKKRWLSDKLSKAIISFYCCSKAYMSMASVIMWIKKTFLFFVFFLTWRNPLPYTVCPWGRDRQIIVKLTNRIIKLFLKLILTQFGNILRG